MDTSNKFLVVAIALMLVACGGGGSGGSDPPVDNVVTSIQLNPPAPSLVIGESLSMSAVARNASGAVVQGVSFDWSSRNAAVVAVDASGRIRGVSAGSTEIVVEKGAIRRTTAVTVFEQDTSGRVAVIELSPPQAIVTEGEIFEFMAIAKDSDGKVLSGHAIAWATLDPGVASVDPSGHVTALRPGTTAVTAQTQGVVATASIRVDAPQAYGLILSADDAPGYASIRTLEMSDPVAALITIPLPGAAVSEPAPSPDGRRLAYVARTINETAIFVADRDGSNVVRLTQMNGTFDQPAWSPDGTRIAFRGRLPGQDSDIWIADVDGSNARNLTIDLGPTQQSSPAWSPLLFGSEYRIAYSHSVNGLGQLYTMRIDGSGKRLLTGSDIYHDDQPSWSPDGTMLVFQRSGDAIFGDLFLVELMTGNVRPLTPYSGPIPGVQLSPAWSPDGRMIAFASRHEDENWQIYTIWADGSKLARRTREAVDLFYPKWLVYQEI